MKTKTYLLSILLLAITSIMGCNGIPDDFDYGKVENNKYVNAYFNCEMTIPKEWKVQTKEQMDNLSKEGQDLIAGDNTAKKAMLKVSEIRTANLLGVFKYERGAPVDFNPNLMMLAENVSSFPGIKTGSDYLFQTRKLLGQTGLHYDMIDSVFKKQQINNTEFYSMNTTIKGGNTDINQVYFSSIIKGFSYGIIITYNSEEEKQELMAIINTLKFK